MLKKDKARQIWYPEDLQVGDKLCNSVVKELLGSKVVEGTYLVKYSFLLENGKIVGFFSDSELDRFLN